MAALRIDPAKINFRTVVNYAQRAEAVYWTRPDILAKYPNTMYVRTLPSVNIQFFLERDNTKGEHFVTIRGTANVKNALVDIAYTTARDKKLGIDLHKGFKLAAQKVYKSLLPTIAPLKDYKVFLCGHSLGAAISTILMMYLKEDGFKLGRSINFGQPKVTDGDGVNKYDSLPLLRVVNETDPVPMVPPVTLLSSMHGVYQHLGAELILLRDEYYTFLSKFLAERESVGKFWKAKKNMDVPDHYMANYIASIRQKLAKKTLVPFEKRKQYMS